MKVYIGTLIPIEGWRTYAYFRENLRNEVNEWIRTTDEIGGVIDFVKIFAMDIKCKMHLIVEITYIQVMRDMCKWQKLHTIRCPWSNSMDVCHI